MLHAGFHHPAQWMAAGGEDEVAHHTQNIQRCVEDVLARVAEKDYGSVAFPLIGTGLFGLPVEVFARLFFTSVGLFARRHDRPLSIALCVLQREQLDSVVRHGTQALAALVGCGSPVLREADGHALVRELRPLARSLADIWLQEAALLRFAEVALATDLALILDAKRVPVDEFAKPLAGSDGGMRMTFGIVRNRIDAVTQGSGHELPERLRRRVEFLGTDAARSSIGRLVADRNNASHNRRPRAVAELVADVENLFGPGSLTEPWPDDAGRWWLRKVRRGHALLDGADFVRGTCTWLLPVLRERETGPIVQPAATLTT